MLEPRRRSILIDKTGDLSERDILIKLLSLFTPIDLLCIYHIFVVLTIISSPLGLFFCALFILINIFESSETAEW